MEMHDHMMKEDVYKRQPTKLKDATVITERATVWVTCTSTGPIAFGRICRRMMRASLVPQARQASIYSWSFTLITAERTIRDILAICETPIAMIMLNKLLPRAEIMVMASNVLGIAIKTSMPVSYTHLDVYKRQIFMVNIPYSQ